MLTFSNYQITEALYESANSLVYRGQRATDGHPVVLKVLKDTYPPPEQIAWFKREYEVTRKLNLPGVVATYSMESDHNHWMIVLEDFGGESLERLKLAGKLALVDFLKLAIKVTEILGQIHQQYIMHKDINPSNIVFNPTSGQIKIIDFGISTVLSRENATFRNPNVLQGTLAYISPEQTGRMNRAMDYRTDFYSLGVTFYQLLTGQLPFPNKDPLELVHCHIAQQPTSPGEINSDIPRPIAEIVLKLMAKNAEDRYQSALGLKADLAECLRQWPAAGHMEPFPLGRQDMSDRFQIPQKLYGREHEIDTLLASFAKVSQGASRLMLVSGYAGIGKSALIQEVYKPITYWRGYFIGGKFDQFQRNIPYAALIQAFRSLIRQLLMENEVQIAAWREKLLAALGPNGKIISEVIPEVELIIGSQPDVPNLPPIEAQNRFNLVFHDFINVFTKPEHPLAIFLDDLQWADGASLKLVERLMTADSKHLFLLGAYRDNEVHATHPLKLTLEKIEEAWTGVKYIALSPLTMAHVNQFLADALSHTPEQVNSLAGLVLTKTGGNPFFINEFLKSLYSEQLLTFDYGSSGWQWDLRQIRAQEMTDNVVELMTGKVQKLPPETQTALEMAACIGSQFDLETLAIVSDESPHLTAVTLWPALAEGMILPLSDAYRLMEIDIEGLSDEIMIDYKFAHDRVQQAAYSLIPDESKEVTHRHIGQLLLKNTPPSEREERLFDIVNHLNLGRALIDDQAERDELAELNLLAGQKARDSAAYQPAFAYLQVGLELLDPLKPVLHQKERDGLAARPELHSWQRQYELTLSLHVEAATAAYLSNRFEEAEHLTEEVLAQAQTLLDKVTAYEVKMQAYYAQLKLLEAVKTGLTVLSLLGVALPEQPSFDDMMAGMQETQSALAGQPVDTLINLPAMADPVQLAVMRLMATVSSIAYIAINQLFPVIVCKQVAISLKHGNTVESTYAYATYGLILCAFGDFDTGYQFGNLAVGLLDRYNAKELKAKIYLVYNFIRHNKEPLQELLPLFLEAYHSGLETGDLEMAANSATSYCQVLYLVDQDLKHVEREMAKYSQAIIQLKQEATIHWQQIYWQGVLNLMGQAQNPCRLVGQAYDEEVMAPHHLKTNDLTSMLHLYTHKLILCYRFQEIQAAVEHADKLEAYVANASAMPVAPPVFFYDSLARLATFSEASNPERENILKKVAANQERMETWSRHAPSNYAHKYHLVEAERARVLGQNSEARDHYEQAIDLAQEQEYLNDASLAFELAGRFYLANGQTRLARYYLRDAHYTYQRWGASAKVKDMESQYAHFLAPVTASSVGVSATTTTTAHRTSTVLDLASVLKASQAISGEIELDCLLVKLIKIVIENAAAQRGFLLLQNKGLWAIEAEGGIEQVEGDTDVTARQSIPVGSSDKLSEAIINYVARMKESVVLNDATQEGIFTQDPYIVRNQPRSILCTPLLNQGKLIGILYLENNLTTGAFTPDRVEVLNILSAQAAISIENASLYSHQVALTNGYSRFVPREFLAFLAKESIVEVKLGDHIQQEMAVLFSDIRAFTTLSEAMTPQENFDFVNAYFGRVSPVIRQHHGIIVKYLGDGMMAVFPRQVEDALNASVAKTRQVAQFNIERRQRGEAPIRIGIGIHAGKMMLGTVGEVERMQGDFLSDAVNLSARLEGLTKTYGASIVISQEALGRLKDPTQYNFRFLGKVQVKGRQEPVSVFEVFDGESAEIVELRAQTKADFEQGLIHYYDQHFGEAKTHLELVLRHHPEDKAAQLYLKRTTHIMKHGLPSDWAGVEALTEK